MLCNELGLCRHHLHALGDDFLDVLHVGLHVGLGPQVGERVVGARRDALAGYRRGLEEARLKFDPTLVVHGESSFDSGVCGAEILLSLDLAQTTTTDEHWQVQDQGFVKEGNAYCAKRDGTTEADFVLRHVQSVKRLLAIEGLVLDEGSVATYADFARRGGAISFGGS